MRERESDPSGLLLRVEQKDINFINQIMEGYEYLGAVSTVKKGVGILRIRTTPDTHEEVLRIIRNMPKNIEILSVP